MHNTPTTSKKKTQPRYGRLDGKPPRKPSGRHAGTKPAKRKAITIPVNQRLGFRVREFAAVTRRFGGKFATRKSRSSRWAA